MFWSPTSDRKSTRLNSSHVRISYAVFCLKKESGLSPGGIWSNEPHAPYVVATARESLPACEAICRRERCPVAVVVFFLKDRQSPVIHPFPPPGPLPF